MRVPLCLAPPSVSPSLSVSLSFTVFRMTLCPLPFVYPSSSSPASVSLPSTVSPSISIINFCRYMVEILIKKHRLLCKFERYEEQTYRRIIYRSINSCRRRAHNTANIYDTSTDCVGILSRLMERCVISTSVYSICDSVVCNHKI
jgi:hypothetical protein